MNGMLTTGEVAKKLNVHTETVGRLCRSGALKASKVGKDWRIKPSDLEAFLNKGSNRREEDTDANAQ